jgi:aspartyl-tRNA(Asn)/glutamyl-tRNA(Gln) amidotransferase subunit A
MAYAHARHEGVLLNRRMVQFFEEYDVLLLPTVPMPAVCRDDKAVMDKGRTHYSRFTSPFNLAGVPALSLPCGFSMEGLPIGLQIIGGQWREAAVLRAAYAYESATDWHTRRPAR